MILIADSGSTSTNWCLVTCGNDSESRRVLFDTEGYNPCYVSQEYILESLDRSLPEGYEWSEVRQVGFYGAGCYENFCREMERILNKKFPNAHIDVAMDLVAAARSLLGNAPGFAAILGTGTNSCIYDGSEVVSNIDSLGFVLGDEGSGGYIGKRLLRDFIRGDMPAQVSRMLTTEYPELNAEYIIEQVYSKPMANRFCAGFTRFIGAHLGNDPYFARIIEESFRDLFDNIVSYYSDYRKYSFNCVGSVGYHFSDILTKVCTEYGMKPGKIVKSPLDGLVKYYLMRNPLLQTRSNHTANGQA